MAKPQSTEFSVKQAKFENFAKNVFIPGFWLITEENNICNIQYKVSSFKATQTMTFSK